MAGIPAAVAQGSITEYDVDVTNEESVADAIRRVTEDLGALDILVNRARIIGPAGASPHRLHHRLRHPLQRQRKGVWLITTYVIPE